MPFQERPGYRMFFQLAKYIPGASFWIVCFSSDEQPGELVPFYTDTGEKILRLLTAEHKIVIKAGISNATNVLNG